MEPFLRAEADLLVFAFGMVMLINIWLKTGKATYENQWIRLFLALVLAMELLLSAFWALSVLDTPVFRLFREAVFFVYYILNNSVPLLWVLFVHSQLHPAKKRMPYRWLLGIPYCFSLILLLLNPFIHSLYYVDPHNIYHTGIFFWLNAAVCYFYMLLSIVMVWVNRKKALRIRSLSLILFCIPPLVCSVVQFAYGGLDLIWAGAVFSIMFIYLDLLSNTMSVDYLTGLANRMQADRYIAAKISKASPGKTFAGIMIDIDRFKEINDRFGHHAGDEALKITSRMLRKCVGSQGFVARLGGDEFLVILDVYDLESARKKVSQINQEFDRFNSLSHRPYELRLSMGYDVYDYSLRMTRQQFIKRIDHLMYNKKRSHKVPGGIAVGDFYSE